MKKIFSTIMAVILVSQGNIYASTDPSNPYSKKEQQDVQKAIEGFEESLKQERKQWRKIASPTGAILGFLASYLWGLKQVHGHPRRGPIWLDPTLIALVSSTGALVGLSAGAALVSGIETWQEDKINNILEARTSFTSLEKLTQKQKTLIVATYRRNIPMMKLLINHQPEFVNRTGVWKTLAELYFNQKPTSGRIQRLKDMIDKAAMPKFNPSTLDQKTNA